MIVHKNEFITAAEGHGMTLWLLAIELGIPVAKLETMLDRGEPFDYEQSRRIMEMLGAETMATVINWEALNVRCPI